MTQNAHGSEQTLMATQQTTPSVLRPMADKTHFPQTTKEATKPSHSEPTSTYGHGHCTPPCEADGCRRQPAKTSTNIPVQPEPHQQRTHPPRMPEQASQVGRSNPPRPTPRTTDLKVRDQYGHLNKTIAKVHGQHWNVQSLTLHHKGRRRKKRKTRRRGRYMKKRTA